MHPFMTRSIFKEVLVENYPIIAILIGVLLVSFSIGLYKNPDTLWEYKAANGVIQWGMPYTEVLGSLINQPPLGFYAEGLFLSIFGLSIETGTILVTIFGLGCIYLVYRIGKELYSKQTGIIASVMFALTPWELVLSRSFLIDTQCLFFSLLTIYFGILAIRVDSHKQFLIAGVAFALGFLTKFYAIFVLFPLALIYVHKKKVPKRLITQTAVFFIPLIVSLLIWNTIHDWQLPTWLPRGLGYMFNHSDFGDFNADGVVPSYSFMSTFLFDGLGYFFVASFITSLAFGLVFRRHFGKDTATYDWIFLLSILAILGLNMYLGVAQNLKVPYTSAIKYSYQALPLFSLVAASIVMKSSKLLKSASYFSKTKKILFTIVGIIGLLLTVTSLLLGIYDAHELSQIRFVIFSVQPGVLLGYSFDNFYTITEGNSVMYIQYAGFLLILSALFYSNKDSIIKSWYRLIKKSA
jgi:4-amino-4-deoxy-L-arabinose transferase-like glycosyltransferase